MAWILATLSGLLWTQKNPQSFHLAGFQDFDDGSGNHHPRILVGWRNLKKSRKLMNLGVFI